MHQHESKLKNCGIIMQWNTTQQWERMWHTTWITLANCWIKDTWPKRIHAVWFYVYKVQNQAEPISSGRSQDNGLSLVELMTQALLEGAFWYFSPWSALWLQEGVLCENSWICTHDLCTFLLWMLYFSKMFYREVKVQK